MSVTVATNTTLVPVTVDVGGTEVDVTVSISTPVIDVTIDTGGSVPAEVIAHISRTDNPHNVQENQIPDGIDYTLLFENALL
jgi:hypothetical protein